MSKIEKDLKRQCQDKPGKSFKVIVTGSVDPKEAVKIGLEPIVGLDNIYSGSLTGAKITEILALHGIESVELDQEMKIL